MSLFDRFASRSSNSNNEPVVATKIGLRVNANPVYYIEASELQGRSISQLFADFATELGIESSQIASFVLDGAPVLGSQVPLPGQVFQGAAATHSKGA